MPNSSLYQVYTRIRFDKFEGPILGLVRQLEDHIHGHVHALRTHKFITME